MNIDFTGRQMEIGDDLRRVHSGEAAKDYPPSG